MSLFDQKNQITGLKRPTNEIRVIFSPRGVLGKIHGTLKLSAVGVGFPN